MKYTVHLATTAALVLSSITGCSAPPVEYKPEPKAAPFTVPKTRADSAAQLAERNAHLSWAIGHFPGDNGSEHRRILVVALEDLSKALQLANGPVQSPQFTNRIAVIDAAHNTASIQSVPRPRMEAVENQALLAADAALDEIITRYVFDDEQLPPMLQIQHADIGKATASIGPLHDADAGQAFRSIENVMQRITDDMTERFATNPQPLSPSANP